MRKIYLLLVMFLLVFLPACGGDESNASQPDAQRGKEIFEQGPGQGAPACANCHSREPGKVIVGPSLAGVAARAGERKPGLDSEGYLRESILDPNAYVVDGFSQGIMYQNFKDVLSEDDLDNLVAYLLTLK